MHPQEEACLDAYMDATGIAGRKGLADAAPRGSFANLDSKLVPQVLFPGLETLS